LLDVISGDFFNQYIKAGTFFFIFLSIDQQDAKIGKGNVLMRSEGRPGIDNLFSLQDG
jgi:hypothetical protein